MKYMSGILALSATAVMMGAHGAEAAPIPFTESYEVEIGGTDYYPDQAPTSPLWSIAIDTAGSTQSLPGGGILSINTAALTDSIRYDVSSGWAPDASGTTLEANLRVVSQLGGAASAGNLVLGAGAQLWVVRFSTTGISEAITGGSLATTTTDALHRYRFLADGTSSGTLDVYKDDVLLGSFASTATPLVTLRFGEDHDGSGGHIQWDYIRWTNDGAFAPIPEPSSALALAALSLLGLRRTRRARRFE